jgi:hypothetical protein
MIEREKGKGYQSYPDYLDVRDRNRTFDGLTAYNVDQAGLDAGENRSRVWVEEVSGNYFDVLRIQPYLGRFLHGSDDHGQNSASYIVLTYAYWHTHFQEDLGVVGRTVQLNKYPFVAVAPPEFHGTLFCAAQRVDREGSSPSGTRMKSAVSLYAGRAFSWHDDENSPRVALVNREFACQQNLWLRNKRNGSIFQNGGGNAHPTGGNCGRRKILYPHRRSTAGDVSPHPAIIIE